MFGVMGRLARWIFTPAVRPAFESPMEERFYDEATRQGIELTGQYRIGPYRADFVVEPVNDYKLAVEIDGRDFHSGEDAVCRDYERDWYFMEHGWLVFRARGRQVWRSPRQTVASLRRVMDRRLAPRLVRR